MALDRNARFVYQSDNFSLTILVGTSVNSTVCYLPDDAFINEFVVKGNYENDLPSGYPLAFSAECVFFTDAFIEEYAELAKWIKLNSSGINKVPNCYIYEYAGKKLYFAQVPSEKEEDDFIAKSYKIQLISTDKWSFERSEFANIGVSELAGSGVLSDLIYNTTDNFNVSSWINTPLQDRFKLAKITDIWSSINSEIASWCSEVHRGLFNYSLYNGLQSLNFFYPNAVEDGIVNQRIGSLGEQPLYICYEIHDADNKIIGGYRKWLTDKYRNVWNFIIAYSEGLGLRYYRNIASGGALDVQYLCQRLNRLLLDFEEFDSDLKGSYSYDIYSQINNRKNLNYAKYDNGIMTDRVLSLSSSMPTLEYNSLINNVLDSHKSRNASTGDFYTIYENSEVGNLPWNRIYYGGYSGLGFGANKVSHACEIELTANPADGVVALQGEGTHEPYLSQYDNVDAFNLYGSAYQLGVPYLANYIIRKVIGERQTWIELTTPINDASPFSLGMEYNLDIFSDTIRNNPFYDNTIYSNIGVLVNIETNFSKGETKCKFFLRSDEWAE